MKTRDEEEEALRSVALQNAQTIMLARQRAEAELVRAKDALELKTRQLAQSLAMLRATLESTTEGILVTDGAGKVTGFNEQFVSMWHLSPELMDAAEHRRLLEVTGNRIRDPAAFVARVDEIYAAAPPESYDLLELGDGKVFERFSRIQFVEQRNVGRVWSFRDITERRGAERALAQQSEWLRVTLASIGDAVVTTDIDGRVLSLNGVAQTLTGWTEQEAAGRPLAEIFRIVGEDTGQPLESPAEKALREGGVVGLANHPLLIAKDGSTTPIDDSAAPIRDEQGRIYGVVLIFRSIAGRRQIELELRRSERELVDFFENASVGMHWVGPDGTILRVNRSELALLGYAAEEYLGHHIAEFHVDQEIIADILGRLAAGETLVDREARMRAKDGSIKHVLIDSSVLWRDGKFIHTRCFTRDVTERRWSGLAQARLASIVESSQDAIISKTLDSRITSWNAGAERLFGYTAEEAIGKLVTMLIPADRENEEQDIVARIQRNEVIEHYETVRVAKDGRRIDISLTISPIRDSSGKIVGASKIGRDITARKREEQERAAIAADNTRLLAALKDADRRKDEFLAMLAHELRNPLAPIRNSVQIFRAHKLGIPELQWAGDVIDRQLQQMARLVEDLLDVSRITRGKIELRTQRIELADVVRSAVEASRPLIEKWGHELTVTLPAQPVYLYADPTRLAQVLLNLLNNAAKYMDHGGRIWLTGGIRDRDIRISVRDSGIGIPAETLPYVFDMFTQVGPALERSEGGLGIGLTLVKRLVELHGGTVEATSPGEGKGSEFLICLPAGVEPADSTEAPPPEEPAVAVEACRILVVDDNRDAADSLGILLRMSGNQVHMAHDGLEAIGAAAAFRPEVVLLDIGLPKLNGYEVARRIREQEHGKEMVLIALTGWGQEEDRRRSREAGFDYHMIKPVEFPALQKLLAELKTKGPA